MEGLYQHQQWLVRQLFADTADADQLDRIAGLYGITRLPAAAATGTINFSGVVGSAIPAGTEAKTLTGIAFVTTAAGTVGAGGTAAVPAQASVAGSAGNQSVATVLTLTAAPAGVNSAATIVTMTGGADVESDTSLLARLLFRLRNPPHGGASNDYYLWAIAVAGVAAAYVYSNRRGLGTTDVIIMATGGLPSAPLIASVQAAIDSVRPVQADALVLAPTAVNVAVTAVLTLAAGTTLATATAAINAALAAYFATLKPGDTVIVNRIRALMQDTIGVVDFTLTAPAANVITLVDATHSELARLGAVTLT
ncbi:MAG: baseplate J/gp47 family protein [Pseudomonadota bacterium]